MAGWALVMAEKTRAAAFPWVLQPGAVMSSWVDEIPENEAKTWF